MPPSNRITRPAATLLASAVMLAALAGCKTSSSSTTTANRISLGALHSSAHQPELPANGGGVSAADAAPDSCDFRALALGVLSSSESDACDATALVAAAPFTLGAGDALGRILFARYLASLDLPAQSVLAAHSDATSVE